MSKIDEVRSAMMAAMKAKDKRKKGCAFRTAHCIEEQGDRQTRRPD